MKRKNIKRMGIRKITKVLFGQKWVYSKCSVCGTFHFRKYGIKKVFVSDPKEKLFRAVLIANDKSKNYDGDIYVPNLPDDEIFNPYDKGGF